MAWLSGYGYGRAVPSVRSLLAPMRRSVPRSPAVDYSSMISTVHVQVHVDLSVDMWTSTVQDHVVPGSSAGRYMYYQEDMFQCSALETDEQITPRDTDNRQDNK